MKRILLLLTTCYLFSTFALADVNQAGLLLMSHHDHHHQHEKHHAHRAAKHHRQHRHRYSI
jgi:ABC-type Zn2+ transport system substrate-binding protein/surface adhesin